MEYKKHRLNIYPEMSEDEFESLKAGMAEEGFDPDYPIILFESAIIDGWNRYRAATQLGIERKFKEFKGSKNDAFEYVIKTNKRRSLSSSQKAAIAVEAEDVYAELEAEVEQQRREKISKRENVANQYTKKEEMAELIPPFPKRDQKQKAEAETRTKLAKKFDTNPRYVSDAKKLREEEPEVFEKIKSGETTITKVKSEDKEKKAHVSNNSGNNEWYTPAKYLDSARAVMGHIDLDPASSVIANERVQAGRIFTAEEDGLKQDWFGNIWMNPPYAQPLIEQFCNKLVSEKINQAIVLVNNATETKWGNTLLKNCSAVCFTKGRIKFVAPDGTLGDSPLQGQMIVYFGSQKIKFIDEFSKYGVCLEA